MPARLSAKATALIKEAFPEEELSLGHVRRFTEEHSYVVPPEDMPDQTAPPTTYLRMMVCTEEYMDDPRQVEDLLKPLIQMAQNLEIKPKKAKKTSESDNQPPPPSTYVNLFYDAKVQSRTTARYAPETKQESAEWSNTTGWPLMWRGNTSAIPTAMAPRDQVQALKYLAEVVQVARESARGIATLIVDPERDVVISRATDRLRSESRPLKHSVMTAIERAAEWRLAEDGKKKREEEEDDDKKKGIDDENTKESPEREGGYLCRGFHVYSTLEPCGMCAMALLHSRVTRLVYLKGTPLTGAIEADSSGLCIHAQDQLNWQYEAWKYSGSAEDMKEDMGDIEHIRAVELGYNV